MNNYLYPLGASLAIILNCLFYQPLMGQSNNKPFIISKTTDFEITGEGTADNWADASWLDLPQRDKDNVEQGLQTRLKALYSDTGIYFFIECEDQVLNATMDEDFMKLWKEDVVEVFLWPDESEPVYFEYELSPLNYELPILISNEQGDLTRWMPFMYENDRHTRHKTSIKGGEKKSGANIDQWTAEFFIPYKLLRPLNNINPEAGTKWRANFYRVDYDNNGSKYSWQEVSGSFHQIEKFGTLLFQ